MPDLALISSLYQTEQFIDAWAKNITDVHQALKGTHCNVVQQVIANEPSTYEQSILDDLSKYLWFSYIAVSRESLYASWNRAIANSNANAYSPWNVDDTRTANAIVDGLEWIRAGASLVYFPFVYKHYLSAFNFEFLVKRYTVTPPPFERKRFINEMHCGPHFMFTRNLYDAVGTFNETYKVAGDFEWCTRAARVAEFTRSDTVSGTFFKRKNTLSGGKNLTQILENRRVLEKKSNMNNSS